MAGSPVTSGSVASSSMASRARGSAPGRLDLLGGVADYSGALVLETPTRLTTTVMAEPADGLVVGPVHLTEDEVAKLADLTYPEVRDALADWPKWTHYLIGVALVLVRHRVIEPPRAALSVASDLPVSVGVSSSAALEVAAARALGAGELDPLRLAALCQEAENYVVGAPCGIMDQVVVAMGRTGAILPILCRPASVRTPVALPPGCRGGRLADGSRARRERPVVPTGPDRGLHGQAHGRARRSGATWAWVSELPAAAVDDLPEVLDGAAFLDRFGGHRRRPHDRRPDRDLSRPGRDSLRWRRALPRRGPVAHLSRHEATSRRYGHSWPPATPATTPWASATRRPRAVVEEALARTGVHGARSSGGGCGGTVVVVCDRGALDDVDGLIR